MEQVYGYCASNRVAKNVIAGLPRADRCPPSKELRKYMVVGIGLANTAIGAEAMHSITRTRAVATIDDEILCYPIQSFTAIYRQYHG